MFVPVQNVETMLVEFVAIEQVRRMYEMEPLGPDDAPPEDGEPQHLMPDGKPWPTSWLHFAAGDGIRVKGSPVMLASQWFGPPVNQPGPGRETRQQRRAAERDGRRIIVPSGIPSVDLKRKQ